MNWGFLYFSNLPNEIFSPSSFLITKNLSSLSPISLQQFMEYKTKDMLFVGMLLRLTSYYAVFGFCKDLAVFLQILVHMILKIMFLAKDVRQ